MALCRCKEHKPRRGGHQQGPVLPIGYPQTSSICGLPNCKNPGVIWLSVEEMELYGLGSRIFTFDHNCSKVAVE